MVSTDQRRKGRRGGYIGVHDKGHESDFWWVARVSGGQITREQEGPAFVWAVVDILRSLYSNFHEDNPRDERKTPHLQNNLEERHIAVVEVHINIRMWVRDEGLYL